MQAMITMLPVDDIVFDSSQPRKFFDEAALAELTESIKQVGILQPIMVQPGPMIGTGHKKSQRPGYKIICGERRYRAAWAAELKEIPCVIREGLSPEEVLEIQITENLQRKDVNPMEEGLAFEKLYSRFPIEEIAKRVGKSEKYVAQRISLSDLIDPWQQLVYNGSITLTDAYKLARKGKEEQQEIYEACTEDWDADDEEPIRSWVLERALDDHDCDLNRAKFDIEDEDLYPEVGACTGCQYNSANRPLLFADLGTNKLCHNSPCYIKKENLAYVRNLKQVMEDPNVVLLSNRYGHYSKEDKARIAEVEAMGCTVLDKDQWKEVDEPTAPEPWEEFLAQQKEDYDWADYGKHEQELFISDWKQEHDELVAEYDRELQEYEEDAAKARDGFIVVGHGEGKRVKVVLKGKGKASKLVENNEDSDQVELFRIEQEIDGIISREDRNQELDREKVMKQLTEHLKLEGGTFLSDESSLNDGEVVPLIIALAASSYQLRDEVEKATGKEYDYSLHGMFEDLLKQKSNQVLMAKMARRFMLQHLCSATELDPDRFGKATALMHLAIENFPSTVETVEMEQKQKAEKRQANVQKRLAALNQQRDKLQEEIQRKKNEAAGKKAQQAAKSKSK